MEIPDNNEAKYFPSGEWEGFYLYPYGSARHKMHCFLTFSNGIVTGGGHDDIGAYSWRGTYDPVARKCDMVKQYFGAHQVFYTGDADENGIWGKWRIQPSFSGGFHLWPKKSDQAPFEEETELRSMPADIEVKKLELV